MSKINVAIVSGGPNLQHQVSLKSAQNIKNNLPEHKYNQIDVYVHRNGQMFSGHKPTSVYKLSQTCDVVFNALHGEYGEDGKLQQQLNQFNLPYTGSGALSSAIGVNKKLFKDIYAVSDLKMPRSVTFSKDDDLLSEVKKIFRSWPMPLMVKPVTGGYSVAAFLAYSFEDLIRSIEEVLRHYDFVLVEEYIRGKEIVVGVVEDFRGKKYYDLLPSEIRKDGYIVDYQMKCDLKYDKVCPAPLSSFEKDSVNKTAINLFKDMHLRDYATFDFIVNRNGVYLIEINTHPGLYQGSVLETSLNSVGVDMSQFFDHIIMQSLNRKNRCFF